MLTATRYLILTFLLCFSLSACSVDMWAASSTAMTTPIPLNQSLLPSHTTTITPIHASTQITAEEFYNLALTHLPGPPNGAMLVRLDSGLLTPLNSEGQSASWTADFWSPDSHRLYTLTLINGIILTQSTPASLPEALVTPESLNLELASFLQTAAAAGGQLYLTRGYSLTAGLSPEGQANRRPAWTVIYLEPDQPVPAFTVVMDARSGQILRSN